MANCEICDKLSEKMENAQGVLIREPKWLDDGKLNEVWANAAGGLGSWQEQLRIHNVVEHKDNQ